MVGKRHPEAGGQAGAGAVPLYGFQPPVGTPYGLEVNTIEDFFAQHDDWPWNPPLPGRASFHYLIGVTEGELLHDVDHVTRSVTPGRWLWVRPGHAQCWHPPGTARGPFILFEPHVLTSVTARLLAPLTAHQAPAVLSPHPDDAPWLLQTACNCWTNTAPSGAAPSICITPCGAAFWNRCCCAWPTPRTSPRPRRRPPRAVLRYTGGSSTRWSCTFANCTRQRTMRSCSAAPCAR